MCVCVCIAAADSMTRPQRGTCCRFAFFSWGGSWLAHSACLRIYASVYATSTIIAVGALHGRENSELYARLVMTFGRRDIGICMYHRNTRLVIFFFTLWLRDGISLTSPSPSC